MIGGGMLWYPFLFQLSITKIIFCSCASPTTIVVLVFLNPSLHSLPLSRKSGFCPEFGQTAKTARFLSRKIGNFQYPLNSRKIKGVWGNIEENEAVFRPIFPIFIPNFGLWWKNRDKSQKIGLKNFFAAFGRTDASVDSCLFSRFLSRFRD